MWKKSEMASKMEQRRTKKDTTKQRSVTLLNTIFKLFWDFFTKTKQTEKKD